VRVIDKRGPYERTIFAGQLDDHASHSVTYQRGGKVERVTITFHVHEVVLSISDLHALITLAERCKHGKTARNI
jgi:hypothetical protein